MILLLFFSSLCASLTFACLPSGNLLGGGSNNCGACPTCPCPDGGATMTRYFAQPPPPPPPPPPSSYATFSHVAPVSYTSAQQQAAFPSSSFQGQYSDRPRTELNSLINNYQESPNNQLNEQPPKIMASQDNSIDNDRKYPIPEPLNYLEHVSFSHTPTNSEPIANNEYIQSPVDPFSTNHSQLSKQIEVAPSLAAITEDKYQEETKSQLSSTTSPKSLITYYNQYCAGDKIDVGLKETFSSAKKKCDLMRCVAANALPDDDGTYTVTYLKSAESRTNKKGTYCLSSKMLPAKSKRIIRRYDDMLASEETSRLRRLLLRHRHWKI